MYVLFLPTAPILSKMKQSYLPSRRREQGHIATGDCVSPDNWGKSYAETGRKGHMLPAPCTLSSHQKHLLGDSCTTLEIVALLTLVRMTRWPCLPEWCGIGLGNANHISLDLPVFSVTSGPDHLATWRWQPCCKSNARNIPYHAEIEAVTYFSTKAKHVES